VIINIISLTTDLEHFGAKLPKDVLDARATLTEARLASAHQPLLDLEAEYDAGDINAGNVAEKLAEATSRLAARTHNQQALNAIENGCTRTMRAGLRDAGERILKALTKPFDEAAEVVQTAGRYFGSDPTPEQIIAGGVPALAAHEKLEGALHTLTQIRSLRVSLADCGYGPGEQDVTWWISEARDVEALEHAERAYSAAGNAFHNLAAAGFTLRMNTPEEARRVATGARAATDAAEAAAREAQLKEHRESWAPALKVIDEEAGR
jgi:hypothetical protein